MGKMGVLGIVLAVLMTVHGEVLVVVPPDQYKELGSGSRPVNGAAVPNFNWVTSSMPSTDFYASAWFKTVDGGDDGADFINFGNTIMLSFMWLKTSAPQANIDGTTATTLTLEGRQNDVWYHAVMGMNGGNAFLVVTLRDVTNFQYSNQGSGSFSLTTATLFYAPNFGFTSAFLVRHM